MKKNNDIPESQLREAFKAMPRERLTATDRQYIMQRVLETANATGVATNRTTATHAGVVGGRKQGWWVPVFDRKPRLGWWVAAGAVAALFATGLVQKLITALLGWLLTPEDVARIKIPEIPWREVAGAVTRFFESTAEFFKGAAHSVAEPFAHAAVTVAHDATSLAWGTGNTMYIVIAACTLLLLTADTLIRKRVRD